MSKKVVKGEEVRQALMRGVNTCADAVKITLGPKGRNAIFNKNDGTPQIINDGISIARTIDLDDELENMGAQLVIQASEKTNDECGDSSTVSCLLTQAIAQEGLKSVTAGANPVEVKKGISFAAKEACKIITNMAKPVDTMEDIKHVATVSAGNDDYVGDIITQAMEKVGKDGVITLAESKTSETNLKVVEGCQHDVGYVSHHFVTDVEKGIVEYENPYILCADKILSNMNEMVPCLEAVAKAQAPLVIISQGIEGELLSTLVVNKLRGMLNVVAVKAPDFGEYRRNFLDDIAVLTGTSLVSEEIGVKMSDVRELSDLGRADKVIVTKETTTIVVNEKTPLLQERIELLKTKIKQQPKDTKLKERLAKLAGGVAVVEVGAPTAVEQKERKLRIEDALNAARTAIAEGVVEGGGVCLLRVSDVMKQSKYDSDNDEVIGINTVINALRAPIKQICENAGVDGNVVANEILSGRANGYNALNDTYVDMFEEGILDPAKAMRCAILNAASVAAMLLTTETAVVEKKKDETLGISTDPRMMMI